MSQEPYGTPILQVLSGSIATGCNTPESDVDILGVFAAPRSDVLTFGPKVHSSVYKENEDDITWWELKHAFDILLKGNFNALPLLYSEYVLFAGDLGQLLRENKDLFLSQRFVKSMLGFSRSQLLWYKEGRSLKNSDPDKALACIYRELIIAKRLLNYGTDFHLKLYPIERDGFLNIKGGDMNRDTVVAQLETLDSSVHALLEDYKKELDSDLPVKPDMDRAKDLLLTIRQSSGMFGWGAGWNEIEHKVLV